MNGFQRGRNRGSRAAEEHIQSPVGMCRTHVECRDRQRFHGVVAAEDIAETAAAADVFAERCCCDVRAVCKRIRGDCCCIGAGEGDRCDAAAAAECFGADERDSFRNFQRAECCQRAIVECVVADAGQVFRQDEGLGCIVFAVITQEFQVAAAVERVITDTGDVLGHIHNFQIGHVAEQGAADVIDIKTFGFVLVKHDDAADILADSVRNVRIIVHITVADDRERTVIGIDAHDVVAELKIVVGAGQHTLRRDVCGIIKDRIRLSGCCRGGDCRKRAVGRLRVDCDLLVVVPGDRVVDRIVRCIVDVECAVCTLRAVHIDRVGIICIPVLARNRIQGDYIICSTVQRIDLTAHAELGIKRIALRDIQEMRMERNLVCLMRALAFVPLCRVDLVEMETVVISAGIVRAIEIIAWQLDAAGKCVEL